LTTEQKEKPTEEELLSKKTEAANRRRMQVEKAARESEVCFCLSKLQVFPPHYVQFYTVRHIHLNSFSRLKLSEKYLVKTPAGKSERIK
jgi:hypothetical protein